MASPECTQASARKRTAVLGRKLEHRLAGYVTAAGAAGVGLLALAQPAKADIIYTPANLPVPHDGSFVGFDLNHDGTADFSLWIRSYADFGPTYIDLFVYAPNKANGVEGRGRGFAARLPAGASIGSEQQFVKAHGTFGIALMSIQASYSTGGQRRSTCAGPWAQPVRNGYLGLEFAISGQVHFGWASLKAGCFEGNGGVTAILTGYAYNTVPDQPLFAGQRTSDGADGVSPSPEPGTLGLLALGSFGLGFWRRRKQQPVTSDK